MLFRLFIFVCVCCWVGNISALDLVDGKSDEATIDADVMEHNTETNIATGTGNVVVTYGEVRLKADKIVVNQNTNDYTVIGNVRVIRPDSEMQTPSAKGNLDTGEVKFGPYRANNGVEYSQGSSGKQNREGKITVNNAWVSTCEYAQPHYQLQAKKITYYKSGYYLAKHVTLRFFRVPVLYLPILFGLDKEGLRSGFFISVGYSGNLGFYTRLGKLWKYADKKGKFKVYGDAFSRHGVGGGVENEYHSVKRESRIGAYHLNDHDPSDTDYSRRFESRESRYRIYGYVREELTDSLSLRINYDKQGDVDVLEDWFKSEYDSEDQKKSFIDLFYNHEYFDAQMNIRPRINDFETVLETMPEFKLNIPSVQIGSSPFVYNSENSMGYYQVKWREFDILRDSYLPWSYPFSRDENSDYAAWRMDTLHTISMPMDFNGMFNVIPRASFRATSYSRSSKKRLTEKDHIYNITADSPDFTTNMSPITHYDDQGGSLVRLAAEIGLEVNSKFISPWFEFDSEFLDFHSVRHILQPYLNYTFAPEPSKDREHIYYFDEIDRLSRQNFLRLGLDQRFQTQRKDEIVNWLDWQSYLDIHFADYEDYDGTWGILGNSIEIPLNKYFRTFGVLTYDVTDGEVQRIGTGFTLGEAWTEEKKTWNLTVGYDYYNDLLPRAAYSMGSNLLDLSGQGGFLKSNFGQAQEITATLGVPITEEFWAKAEMTYDLKDNQLSKNFYYFTKVLHCWTMTFGLGWDNGEFKTMMMFYLTALPHVGMHMDLYTQDNPDHD